MLLDQDEADLELLAEATTLVADTIADAAINARLREIVVEVRDMARRSLRSRGGERPSAEGWVLPGMRRLPA